MLAAIDDVACSLLGVASSNSHTQTEIYMSKPIVMIDSNHIKLAGGGAFEAIDRDALACATGGRGEINDYGDLSNVVDHGGEKHRMTPAERLNKFLYGGAMAKGDRATLIRNWEESNGRTAPPRIEGTPEKDW